MFTKKRIKMAVGLLAGFVAGVAFVIACNGGRGADAQTACLRWEVVQIPPSGLADSGRAIPDPNGVSTTGFTVRVGPDGWEPFAVTATTPSSYLFRRCAN